MAYPVSPTPGAYGLCSLSPSTRYGTLASGACKGPALPSSLFGVRLQTGRCPQLAASLHAVVSNGIKHWLHFRDAQPPLEEHVMRVLASATSAPVAQYISSPVTWLHSLDPRVKQAWLFVLVLLPSNSHVLVRSSFVTFLVLATAWALPRHVWQDQLRRMTLLSAIVLLTVIVGADSAPPPVYVRGLPPAMEGLSNVYSSRCGYSFLLFKLGPLHLTRKGLRLAVSASCLSFIVLQSATLCLTTTTPEQLAAALRWHIQLLTRARMPVDELILSLLLSLRFIGIVFDELRNLALAVVSRVIQSQSRTLVDTIDTLLTVFGRLFKNLFAHSEQISEAMIARGYKGVAANHEAQSLRDLQLTSVDVSAIIALLVVSGIALVVEFGFF